MFPVHPRTRSRLGSANETGTVAPLSHGATLEHIATSRVVLTDSGGIQEEACILGTPCVTLRKSTERIETLRIGANRLAEPQDLLRAVAAALASDARWQQPYGDGKAGQRTLDSLC